VHYSLVVPVYNDGALAADFCHEVKRVFTERLGDDLASELEVVFVDDGSRNDSLEQLKKLTTEFRWVKVVSLSRNFGQHIAISCGYAHARGDVVVYLNIDQEDPPNQIFVVTDELEKKGLDYVGGIYTFRDVPLLSRITSYLFTLFLNRLTGYAQPTNASTLRAMNRRFIDAYNSLGEKSRYIPGLEMWLGYKHGHVSVKHQRRGAGKSSYNFSRRLRLAMNAVISFSDYPLRLSVKFGILVTIFGFLLIIALIIDKLFLRELLPGYATTIAAIVVMGGVQIIVTSVASLYVGRILAEVQNRPLYLVRERFGDLPER
jgi:dolichol-phosphate mannosyltransferase